MLLLTRCPACARPVVGSCAECWQMVAPAPLGAAHAAAIGYHGVGRRLLIGLKYSNRRSVAAPLGERMAAIVAPGSVDLVTWAPTSRRRARARGVDQAELLARVVAAELGVPCRRMLRRSGGRRAQTGRSRVERQRAGPCFVARRTWRPLRILVVDDVVTTGATLRAARRALVEGGAGEVVTLAGAATP